MSETNERLIDLTKKKMIIQKIKPQFFQEENDSAEKKLHFAVVERAIEDLFEKREKSSAENYIKGDMLSAEICGVSADWIRRIIKKIRAIDFAVVKEMGSKGELLKGAKGGDVLKAIIDNEAGNHVYA